MRFSQVLALIVTSVLFLGAVISTIISETKHSNMHPKDDPNHRFLRAYPSFKGGKNTEERGITKADWVYLKGKAANLSIDLKRAINDVFYQQRIPREKYLAFQKSLNRLMEQRKSG
ncbi:RxLR effector protein [Phytophthora megakarya]|uniref:RxLR effector protein n=1 Tax=Phytophthora megakarya TaxID=4795 RepID=A0A225W2Z9_9STRA|nr:RxLR effector protein [Phytophthora megakarya]